MKPCTYKSQVVIEEKSVLEQLLYENQLTVTELAKMLGISRETIWKYRAGKIPFKLDMEQIKILDELLQKTGRRLPDLPTDWILDKT